MKHVLYLGLSVLRNISLTTRQPKVSNQIVNTIQKKKKKKRKLHSRSKYLSLTLQHLKLIWSRRLFKHINKNLKLLKTPRYICHMILKTLLPKEILLSLSNIFFGHNVFKSRLLQRRLYASPGDEELRG